MAKKIVQEIVSAEQEKKEILTVARKKYAEKKAAEIDKATKDAEKELKQMKEYSKKQIDSAKIDSEKRLSEKKAKIDVKCNDYREKLNSKIDADVNKLLSYIVK